MVSRLVKGEKGSTIRREEGGEGVRERDWMRELEKAWQTGENATLKGLAVLMYDKVEK